jgi:polysaccharide biosynthesis/export protein
MNPEPVIPGQAGKRFGIGGMDRTSGSGSVPKRSRRHFMGIDMYIKEPHRTSAGLLVFAFGGILFSQAARCQPRRIHILDPPTSAQQATAREGGQAEDPSYVIGTDDLLAINVWNEPDLRQSVPVRPDGKISLPLIGDIQAAGLTPAQLQKDIAAKLKTYITHPDVTVIVQQINSKKYNILGRVAKPGSYPLSTTTTVLDAIARAGGFQDFAKEKDVYILREKVGGDETRIAFNYKDVIRGKHPEQNIKLKPGDTIVVP